MTCESCGTVLERGQTICPVCGASRTPGQARGGAMNEAARRYRDSMEEGKSVRRTQRSVRPEQQPTAKPPITEAAPKTPVRDASKKPDGSRQPDKAARESGRARSMPPSAGQKQGGSIRGDEPAPRMVRRYEYEAISPQGPSYESFNWVRLCVITFICVLLLTAGLYFFLAKTFTGQYWLASMGFDATSEAYHTLGRDYMAEGSVVRAAAAFEVAQVKDTDNLEVLIDLGKAYMANNRPDRAEIAFTRAIQYWPEYPESYQRLIEIMREQGRNYEALQLVALAMEKCYDDSFQTLYNDLIPATPSASVRGGRFTEVIEDLMLTCEEGATIYYTFNGDDPISEGVVYDGKPIYLEEDVWKLRAVAEKDGMYSAELTQTYTINKPLPDVPRATLLSGTYSSPRTVSLKAGANTTVYYTVDGTTPTTESKVFEEPIKLGYGNTTIRAIAVDVEGKASNELSIGYKIEGTLKNSMDAGKDVIDKLALYKTNQSEFTNTYGQPQSTRFDGEDSRGTYTKLIYPFGYAVFLDKGDEGSPVLTELSTNSTEFSGPRSTKVGMRMEDVLAVFRDAAGEANAKGDRILYNFTYDKDSTKRMGMLTKLSENEYKISYYYGFAKGGQFIELSYYAVDGLITRMEWLQYDTE